MHQQKNIKDTSRTAKALRPRLMHEYLHCPDPVSAELGVDHAGSQSEARVRHDVSIGPDRVSIDLTSVSSGYGRDAHNTVCIVRITRHDIT